MVKEYKMLYKAIKGLDEKVLKKLNSLGLKSLYDILYYFPRAYEDRTNIKKINELRGEEYAVIKAKVVSASLVTARNRTKLFKVRVSDGSGYLDLTWFQMAYLKNVIKEGKEFIFIGKVKRSYTFQMVNPEYRKCDESCSPKGEIKPVYSAVKSIKQTEIVKLVDWAMEEGLHFVWDNIPKDIRDKYKIMDRVEALRTIHKPRNYGELEEAKRRFAVEELFILETGILASRYDVDTNNKEIYKLEDNKKLVRKFIEELHFELTKAQKKVVTEIHKELSMGSVVNRLIQGDVGSGKTIVAEIMLLYMVENSYQGVLMAPTEILAVQHYLSMVDELHNLGIRVEVLTGSVKGKKREKLISEIKAGLVDIVIGTHALIEDDVEFHKLGLIIIDEQHRFGVEQRRKLREKGIYANLLVMSATPIPRSLALSIYGDLDVSIIDQLPPGRQPVKTKWIENEIDKLKMYDFIKKKLDEGRQVYFVAPLIEESESLNVKSATELYEDLKENIFRNYKLDLLHGRMKNSEKEEIMHGFKKGDTQILVSTTVIEVGVNVPNASVMCIVDAQRFGLSALHQLRGRVGRGEHKSYCFLVAYTNNDISVSRLRILEKTTDGFEIAEEDLRLRKAGEIFGTKQSGLSDLKFVDVVHDIKTIKLVREISMEYLKKNKGQIDNVYLKKDIEEKFGI